MATIVTRTGKGSALTFAEGDANFTNLNNDKLENINSESIGDLSDVDLGSNQFGTVTATDAVRNPNTLSLTGVVLPFNTRLRFTGGDVTSAGLALNTDYYIAAVVGGVATYELSTSSNGSPIGITNVSSITDFSYEAFTGTTSTDGTMLIYNGAEYEASKNLQGYTEEIFNIGSNDTPSINADNANVQSVTIGSALTLPAFTDPVAGQSVTLLVNGSGTASGTGAYVFAGGNKTLTTKSIVSIFFDGTTYWTSIATDFQA